MTERVTIDVDPSIVEDLRRAACLAGWPGPGVALNEKRLRDLADTIEAALPIPEPAPGSVVRLRDGSFYGRTSDRDDARWARMAGSGDLWESWDYLRHQGATLVFDGATLA